MLVVLECLLHSLERDYNRSAHARRDDVAWGVIILRYGTEQDSIRYALAKCLMRAHDMHALFVLEIDTFSFILVIL